MHFCCLYDTYTNMGSSFVSVLWFYLRYFHIIFTFQCQKNKQLFPQAERYWWLVTSTSLIFKLVMYPLKLASNNRRVQSATHLSHSWHQSSPQHTYIGTCQVLCWCMSLHSGMAGECHSSSDLGKGVFHTALVCFHTTQAAPTATETEIIDGN